MLLQNLVEFHQFGIVELAILCCFLRIVGIGRVSHDGILNLSKLWLSDDTGNESTGVVVKSSQLLAHHSNPRPPEIGSDLHKLLSREKVRIHGLVAGPPNELLPRFDQTEWGDGGVPAYHIQTGTRSQPL